MLYVNRIQWLFYFSFNCKDHVHLNIFIWSSRYDSFYIFQFMSFPPSDITNIITKIIFTFISFLLCWRVDRDKRCFSFLLWWGSDSDFWEVLQTGAINTAKLQKKLKALTVGFREIACKWLKWYIFLLIGCNIASFLFLVQTHNPKIWL